MSRYIEALPDGAYKETLASMQGGMKWKSRGQRRKEISDKV